MQLTAMLSSLSLLPLSCKPHPGTQGLPPAGGDKLEQISMELVRIQNAAAASLHWAAPVCYATCISQQFKPLWKCSLLYRAAAQSTQLETYMFVLLSLHLIMIHHGLFFVCQIFRTS